MRDVSPKLRIQSTRRFSSVDKNKEALNQMYAYIITSTYTYVYMLVIYNVIINDFMVLYVILLYKFIYQYYNTVTILGTTYNCCLQRLLYTRMSLVCLQAVVICLYILLRKINFKIALTHGKM